MAALILRPWGERRCAYRFEASARIAPFGGNVIAGSGSISWPGSTFISQRWAMVASTRTASVQAKPSPMHWRGPPPKGK